MSVFPSISAPFSPCCEVDVTPATRYCGARSFPLHVKILPRLHPHKNFPPSPKPRRTALDKPMKAGIIKITKDTATSGRPRSVHKIKKNFLKPSLCRVAVSPVNADRNGQSKDMESQCDRHRNTPFTEDSGENRPSLCWRPWGSIEPELFYQTNRKMSTKGSPWAQGEPFVRMYVYSALPIPAPHTAGAAPRAWPSCRWRSRP